MAKFSVIIPVYKVEKYIAKCIKSLLKQTFDDFECIFVDDCGGDSSIDIIKRYAENNSQLKIVYQPENLGVGAARNRGIDESCGEYITFVDPDDWVETDYL